MGCTITGIHRGLYCPLFGERGFFELIETACFKGIDGKQPIFCTSYTKKIAVNFSFSGNYTKYQQTTIGEVSLLSEVIPAEIM